MNKIKWICLCSFLIGMFLLTGCNDSNQKEKETTKKSEPISILPEKESTDYMKDIKSILKTSSEISNEKIEKAISKTEEDDYTLKTALENLGNPHYILDTYDGKTFYVYDEKLIEKKLNSIKKDKNYKEDSYVKIGWLTSDDMIISTYIPYDLKSQITGYIVEDIDSDLIEKNENINKENISQDLKTPTLNQSEENITSNNNNQNIEKNKIKIETTEKTIADIVTIDKTIEELETLLGSKLYCYRIQYPMSYESKFIQERMDETSSELISKDYVIYSGKGYLHIQTFEDIITNVYQVYGDDETLPIIKDDIATKIQESSTMTAEEFFQLVPNAKKVEILRSSFNNTVSTISCYAFQSESNKEKSKDQFITIQIAEGLVINQPIASDDETIKKETETNKETTKNSQETSETETTIQ